MEYPGGELHAMGEARNYHRWILGEFRPFLGKRILEVGAGIGTFSSYLLETAIEELILLEPAPNLFPVLQRCFGDEGKVTLIRGGLGEVPNELQDLAVDTVVSVNVLEHISEDVAALQAMSTSLRQGGTLLLFVPALPCLYGTLDAAFGHVRRYTKPEFSEKLHRAGFRIVKLQYWNLPGIITWFMAGRVLRQATLSPWGVKLYDRIAVPVIAKMERVFFPPIGQSLIAICTKP